MSSSTALTSVQKEPNIWKHREFDFHVQSVLSDHSGGMKLPAPWKKLSIYKKLPWVHILYNVLIRLGEHTDVSPAPNTAMLVFSRIPSTLALSKCSPKRPACLKYHVHPWASTHSKIDEFLSVKLTDPLSVQYLRKLSERPESPFKAVLPQCCKISVSVQDTEQWTVPVKCTTVFKQLHPTTILFHHLSNTARTSPTWMARAAARLGKKTDRILTEEMKNQSYYLLPDTTVASPPPRLLYHHGLVLQLISMLFARIQKMWVISKNQCNFSKHTERQVWNTNAEVSNRGRCEPKEGEIKDWSRLNKVLQVEVTWK